MFMCHNTNTACTVYIFTHVESTVAALMKQPAGGDMCLYIGGI